MPPWLPVSKPPCQIHCPVYVPAIALPVWLSRGPGEGLETHSQMSLRRALSCEIEESNPCPPNIQRLPEASVQVEPPQREPGAVAMDPGPAIGVPVPSVP